jgi:hypothetical protein
MRGATSTINSRITFDAQGRQKGRKIITHADNMPFPEPIWFDTGKRMADGITPRLMAARTPIQYADYVADGWNPVSPQSETEPIAMIETSPATAMSGVSTSAMAGRKRGRPRRGDE